MASQLHVRKGSVLTKARVLEGNIVDDNGNALTFSQVGSTSTYKDNTSGLYFDTPDPVVTIRKSGSN